MASSLSVPYAIDMHVNSSEFQGDNIPGPPTARITFTCFASDHYQLVKDLLGYPVAIGGVIVRTYPFQYPPSPNLICTAIESVEFFGRPTPVPNLGGVPWIWRSHCRVRARFELPSFANNANDPSGLPYTTTSFQGVTDVLTLPSSTFSFPSGQPTETPLGIKIAKVQI